MGFDRNLQPVVQPRWTLEMERQREMEREHEVERERRGDLDVTETPHDDRVPDDPDATTDPAMPSGTTPLERDQRPINQSH